jgi:transposase-like protein
MKANKHKTYSAAEKEALLNKYKTSGALRKQWCKENGISLSTLQRWLKDEQNTQTWVSVVTAPPKYADAISIQAGTFTIPITQNTDVQLLAKVLKVIMELC